MIDYPQTDNLNAAISGAMAVNLDLELDYLLERTYYAIFNVNFSILIYQ